MRSLSRSILLGATLLLTACANDVADEGDGEEGDDAAAAEEALSGAGLKLGWAGGRWDAIANPMFDDIQRSTSGKKHPGYCHAYTSWDTLTHPGGEDDGGSLARWERWHAEMKGRCEIMVTFKSTPRNGVEPKHEPSVADFEDAFKAFRKRYPDVHVFTTWNEANNGHASGNGLDHQIPAETAAKYYLALRRSCRPSAGCLVATPDFLGWYDASAFQMKCGSDPDELCADGSYLDRFKYYLVKHAKAFGFSSKFRPEYVALHPWNDAFRYTRDKSHCSDPKTCVTKAALENLGGSWKRSYLWMTEVGVHSDKGEEMQACGGAFLNRLFENPRVTRYYYYTFCHGVADGDTSAVRPGPGNSCKSGTTPRPIAAVLRDRKKQHTAACP